jgi:hypothetical protein
MLGESLEPFNCSDDISIGILAAILKMNHYYDQISPMGGIALILDPTMKKDFLTNKLGWKSTWVDSGMGAFHNVLQFLLWENTKFQS